MSGLEGAPLAKFKRRKPGELRIVELQAASGDQPALLVQFEIPTGLMLAEAEANVQAALAIIRENPAYLSRYGVEQGGLTDAQIMAVGRIASATETAALLWRAWNYSRDEDAAAAPLEPAVIAELLHDQQIRAAWMLHLDAASPLERSEGNGSGASLNGSSEEAPNTADDVTSAEAPAPGDNEPAADGSAPA